MGRGQAGVMMLRPCSAVAAHMLQLASSNRLLQFPYHDAEQDFFDWCAPVALDAGNAGEASSLRVALQA
jgi:hypothetical protein